MDNNPMGNQQERQVAQARLAMLFDTEGYLTLNTVRRSRDRGLNLVPCIGMTNTSVELVEWAADTLESLNVSRYVQWVNPTGYGKLRQGRVIVAGLLRVKDLLPIIRPYLIVKYKQADMLKEFIDSRLKAAPKQSYSDRELELADAIRGRNTKGRGWRPVSSTTTRDAAGEFREHLKAPVEDIV